MLMSEFDFLIKHKPGTHHRDLDCLSRTVPLEASLSEEEDRNTFAFLTLEVMDEVREKQEQDVKIREIRDLLRQGNIALNFELHSDVVFYNPTGIRRLYVPTSLRDEFLFTYQADVITGGHFGEKKTYDKMVDRLYWPKGHEDLKNFINSCDQCLKVKIPRVKPAGLLEPLPVTRPFQMIGMDTVGPFPESSRNRYILVATDYFTKWAETRAVSANTAKAVATFIKEQIICRHGFPEVIVTDRGANYTSNMVKELLASLDCRHAKTSAYHPQTNGLCKKVNGILCTSLKNYVDEQHSNWSSILPLITFAYNCSKSSTTKLSPFFLLHKEKPIFPGDLNVGTVPDGYASRAEFVQFMKQIWPELKEKVLDNNCKAQRAQKAACDQKRQQVIYLPNEKVMLYRPVRKVGKSEKLLSRYFGPYTVVERLLDNCYKLQVGRKFEIAHVSRLKTWYERTQINGLIIEEGNDNEETLELVVISAIGGSSRMLVEVSILSQPMSALIDTGANASFMSLDQLMHVQLHSIGGLTVTQLGQRVRLADG